MNFARSVMQIPLTITCILFTQCLALAADQSFFPTHPKGIKLSRVSGVLTDYGIGNNSGSFSIKLQNGRFLDFYPSLPMHIGRHVVECILPPKEKFHPPKKLCSDWPSNMTLGKTIVTVSYWTMLYNGETVNVSDEINVMK